MVLNWSKRHCMGVGCCLVVFGLGIASAAGVLIGVHSLCCRDGIWQLFVVWGCFFLGMLSSRSILVLLSLALIRQFDVPLCCSSVLPFPRWYGLVLVSCLLWPIDRCMASHHPLVCSGSLCAGGMQCHATLFSVVRKLGRYWCFFHLHIVIWSGFLGCCSTVSTLQSSEELVVLCLVVLSWGVGCPSCYKMGCW